MLYILSKAFCTPVLSSTFLTCSGLCLTVTIPNVSISIFSQVTYAKNTGTLVHGALRVHVEVLSAAIQTSREPGRHLIPVGVSKRDSEMHAEIIPWEVTKALWLQTGPPDSHPQGVSESQKLAAGLNDML